MLDYSTILLLVLVCAVIKFLHLATPGQCPILYFKDPKSSFIRAVLRTCPILTTEYHPPYFWGKSGHLQTVLHVKMGRVKPKWPNSERKHILLPDGATMSYDLFSPEKLNQTGKYILAVCPGIANSSECIYLRTFAAYANSHGYRMAILNHLGALKSEKLTSPRIFTYGGTDEFGTMIDRLRADYPDCKLLAIGFSMGGNLVTKYLGENPDNQKKVLCGMSVCQGYEVNDAMPLFLQWSHLRRVYTYMMTLNQRRLLSRHRSYLFGEQAKKVYGELHEDKVFSATALCDIDENDTCFRAGFASLQEYYNWSSSAYHMHKIKIPMFYMNSEDDPVCPVPLLKRPKAQAESGDNCIFMKTKHGGHLGYFEGGYFVPYNLTWLDRVLIQYADAVTSLHRHGELPGVSDNVESVETSDRLRKDNQSLTETLESEHLKENKMSEGFNDTECYKRFVTVVDKEKGATSAENQEKKNSLKRGTILQQATSYVQ